MKRPWAGPLRTVNVVRDVRVFTQMSARSQDEGLKSKLVPTRVQREPRHSAKRSTTTGRDGRTGVIAAPTAGTTGVQSEQRQNVGESGHTAGPRRGKGTA